MKPRGAGTRNQYFHRASPKYRDDVKRKLHAYHVFIQTGLIRQRIATFPSHIPGSSGPPDPATHRPNLDPAL